MQQPLKITFRGLEHSDAIDARIRQKAAQLERFYPHVTSCHVIVEVPHQHQHRGRLYSVRLDIHVPDSEIVVNREHQRDHAHEDAYVAVRDAFDAAVRQLQDYARHRRGQVKRHSMPEHGKIKKLFRDDGYGFAETPDGLDVYFHENAVTDGTLAGLSVGDEVRLVIAEGEGERGPQASTVTPIGKHHPGVALEE